MKPTITPLKPALEKERLKFIADFAAVELNTQTVRMRMYEAARKGRGTLRLRMPDGIDADIRQTDAAKELSAWCRQNDFTLTWESRVIDTDDGRRATVWEPEISW